MFSAVRNKQKYFIFMRSLQEKPKMDRDVFWVVAPYRLVEVHQFFRGGRCLHYRGDHPSKDGGSKHL
jgi:hypothetical protein